MLRAVPSCKAYRGRKQERVLRGAFGTFGGVWLAASKTMPMPRALDIIFSARSAHRGPFAQGATGGSATPFQSLGGVNLRRWSTDQKYAD
jgi:hypothetical protein